MTSEPTHWNRQSLGRLAQYLAPKEPHDPITLTLPTLDYHGVTMLAYAAGHVQEPLRSELKARRANSIANEMLKRTELMTLAALMEQAGLTPIAFKGTALAYSLYEEPWLRPRTDLDLLIDTTQISEIEAVFNHSGYKKRFAIEGELVSHQSTYSKRLSKNTWLDIDLHWKISNRHLLAHAFNHSELLKRAQVLPALGLNVPAYVDSLLIACLHRLGHHHQEERLAWLYDIALLAKALNESEWQEVQQIALEKRIAQITLDGLTAAAGVFDFAPPAAVLSALANSKDEPSAIFTQRDTPEWRIFLQELRALPNTRQKWLWLRETLLPKPAYLRQQMQEDSLFKAHSQRILR